MKSLYREITDNFNEKREDIEEKILKWYAPVVKNLNILAKGRLSFRQWGPLRVYTSVSRAGKAKPSFSLRFYGEEIGEVVINENRTYLNITQNHRKLKLYDKLEAGIYPCPWDGPHARRLRKHFNEMLPENTKSIEHQIESALIWEMMKTTGKDKFNGKLRDIQPITLGGCPLQFSVPISASKKREIGQKGNIDILARRKVGQKVNISLWELKRPHIFNKQTLIQLYSYAVTLHLMLRTKHGEIPLCQYR